MKPIRILSPALEPMGEIDSYLSLSFCRRYHSPGEFQIVTNRKTSNAALLGISSLIMLGGDKTKAGIIRYSEIKTNERGEEIVTCRGCTLEGILKQRITIPPVGQAYDIQQGDVETVIKNYVSRNCIEIEEMTFPNLIIAPNQNRGEQIAWQSRYKNLVDELEQVSRLSGMGWQIYLDFDLKKWVFDIYMGENHCADQQANPPVIFSPEFENVKSQEYTDSIIDYCNYAIVAGQGEGADREVAVAGTPDTGFSRSVAFIDARDIEDSADLEAVGLARLSEYKRAVSFQSEILTKGPFEYQKDWDVGDIVTVQNKAWNLTMNTRITEVKEIYEAGGFKLNVTFGNAIPTLVQRLKTELNAIKTEATK